MQLETGRPFYGQHIGVLVFSTVTPRIPGDAGHAETFSYPVRYEVVQGGFADLIEGGPAIQQNLLDACLRLKKAGARGIVGDCGLMSLYQDFLGAEVGLPFVGSALCQIPTVWQMVGRKGAIGVLTGHSELLGARHLRASGWREEIHISVQGLQDEDHFREIVIEGGLHLDPKRMEEDVLRATQKLMNKTPNLAAIIVECSNLGTYARKMRDLSGVPVFDVISAANLLAYSVHPPLYLKGE